jgi:hypothetical protein
MFVMVIAERLRCRASRPLSRCLRFLARFRRRRPTFCLVPF